LGELTQEAGWVVVVLSGKRVWYGFAKQSHLYPIHTKWLILMAIAMEMAFVLQIHVVAVCARGVHVQDSSSQDSLLNKSRDS
jgi:hypothetical protein